MVVSIVYVYVILVICCLVCEFGVNLDKVKGIGCKGCIVKEDIEVYVKIVVKVYESGVIV